MPFKRVNAREEVKKRLCNNADLCKEYERAESEYELVKQLIQKRNELGFTQKDIAKISGLKQQTISRIETAYNSPTLRNLVKYADGLNSEMKLEKKSV